MAMMFPMGGSGYPTTRSSSAMRYPTFSFNPFGTPSRPTAAPGFAHATTPIRFATPQQQQQQPSNGSVHHVNNNINTSVNHNVSTSVNNNNNNNVNGNVNGSVSTSGRGGQASTQQIPQGRPAPPFSAASPRAQDGAPMSPGRRQPKFEATPPRANPAHAQGRAQAPQSVHPLMMRGSQYHPQQQQQGQHGQHGHPQGSRPRPVHASASATSAAKMHFPMMPSAVPAPMNPNVVRRFGSSQHAASIYGAQPPSFIAPPASNARPHPQQPQQQQQQPQQPQQQQQQQQVAKQPPSSQVSAPAPGPVQQVKKTQPAASPSPAAAPAAKPVEAATPGSGKTQPSVSAAAAPGQAPRPATAAASPAPAPAQAQAQAPVFRSASGSHPASFVFRQASPVVAPQMIHRRSSASNMPVQRSGSGVAFPFVRSASGVVAPSFGLQRSASGVSVPRMLSATGHPIPQSGSAIAAPGNRGQKRLVSVRDVGYSEDPNWAHNSYMEDEHVIIDAYMDDPGQGLFAVYDGHGGREAVEFAASNLHNYLAEEIRYGNDITTALKNAFWATDQAMLANAIGLECGCTALVAFVTAHLGPSTQVLVANAGDTRAVISRGGTAMRVSIDHKATDAVEARRVRASGGFIEGKRVGGVTQTSRGLGDHDVPHLIPEPDVHQIIIEPTDEFLILATDGVWDVIDDQLSINICRQMSTVQEMAETLVRAAIQLGSEDNTSALVIGF